MGIVLRLYNIDIKNDYYLYYKESLTLGDENKGFVKYGELVNKDNNIIILSGITINFNSNYWVKIVDSITNEYIIKEIILHEKEILKENKTVSFFNKIFNFFKKLWERFYNNIYTKKEIMGVVLRLHDISINNDYYVYYKESLTLGDENKGFVKYGDLTKKENNIIILSGITFNFNSNYWIKIVDSVTKDYVIKNIAIHESKTFKEYDKINFHVEVNNGIITIYDDNITENINSVIDGEANSFLVYSGLTSESFISGSTRLLGVAKRRDDSKILYEFKQQNNDDFYVFLVHADGYNIYNEKQGAFSVRKVNVNNFISNILPTVTPTKSLTPSPTPTIGLSPSPTPTKTVTPTPTRTNSYVEPLDFNNTYTLSYTESFPFSTDKGLAGFDNAIDRTKNTYLQMALAGVDQIFIDINWDDVFSTYSEQQSNSSSSWVKYDALIDYAKTLTSTKNKPMKVALRIIVSKDDSIQYDLNDPNNNNGWYGLSNSAKDQFGYPIRVGNGYGHVSLSYPAGVQQIYDFVRKTLLRYQDKLGSQFSWYSVVTSSQYENGSNYENQHYVPGSDNPIPLYPALFDYSTYSINSFRNAMQTKYGTIANLNNAWNTNESNFTNIQPPGLGVSGSHEELNNVYKTNKGKDWYYFNENIMFKFLKECEKIGSDNNVSAKFTTESGSDTDVLSIRRQSIDIARWVDIGQMHKTQLGGFTGNSSFSHSIDILRTNYARKNRKLGTEINTNDFVTQFNITGTTQMQSAMYEMAQYSILDAEAKEIIIISSRTSPYYDTAKNVVSQVRDLMVNPISRVPSNLLTFEYNVNQIINNNNNWLRDSMIFKGHTLSKRISAIQVGNNVQPSPLPTSTPNNDNGIYKSLFTFNQKSNGQSVPTTGDYTNGYLKFYAFSHGITRKLNFNNFSQDKGSICKFEYEILNSDGEVVISCKDNYGGFHPNFSYTLDDLGRKRESYDNIWVESSPFYDDSKWIRDFFTNFTKITPNHTGIEPLIKDRPFYIADDRSNNHFDAYNFYLPLNKSYIMRIKNTGTFSFQLRAGSLDTFDNYNNPNLADAYRPIPPDNEWYDIALNRMRENNNDDGQTRAYKINCYNY